MRNLPKMTVVWLLNGFICLDVSRTWWIFILIEQKRGLIEGLKCKKALAIAVCGLYLYGCQYTS